MAQHILTASRLVIIILDRVLTHTLRGLTSETVNGTAFPGGGGYPESYSYDSAGKVTTYWDAAHPTTGKPTAWYQYRLIWARVWND